MNLKLNLCDFFSETEHNEYAGSPQSMSMVISGLHSRSHLLATLANSY